MGAYKKLNKQDAYITTYTARKSWAAYGDSTSQEGTFNSNYTINWYSAGFEYLNSIQQLYYPSKSEGIIPSHSFDYYDQTTLYNSSSRSNLITGSFILSMPRKVYGTHIQPGSFKLTVPTEVIVRQLPIVANYVAQGYLKEVPGIKILDPTRVGGPRDPGLGGPGPGGPRDPIDPVGPRDPILIDPEDPPFVSVGNPYVYLDDSEGSLYLSGSSPRQYVGDIVYTHGMAIVTSKAHIGIITSAIANKKIRTNVLLNWQSNQPIFTHNYHCRLRESEFNFTYNPSSTTSSFKATYDNNGDIYSTSSKSNTGYLNNNITGSAFQPYITTVGLYNDTNELIAVGKMAQPIPKSANTEMTFIVKIDI